MTKRIGDMIMAVGITMLSITIIYMFAVVIHKHLIEVNAEYQSSIIRDTFNG